MRLKPFPFPLRLVTHQSPPPPSPLPTCSLQSAYRCATMGGSVVPASRVPRTRSLSSPPQVGPIGYVLHTPMPTAPLKQCGHPGCGNLTSAGKCSVPANVYRKQREERRLNSHDRGYDKRWRRESAAHRFLNPLCADPYRAHGGRPTAAEVTDHIVPHRGNAALFWDKSNWQSLCKPCHDRKTATEDGGFGHARADREAPRGGSNH